MAAAGHAYGMARAVPGIIAFYGGLNNVVSLLHVHISDNQRGFFMDYSAEPSAILAG